LYRHFIIDVVLLTCHHHTIIIIIIIIIIIYSSIIIIIIVVILLDSKQQGSSDKWLSKVSSKNDSFTRAHEDPFILIKQQENKVTNYLTYSLQPSTIDLSILSSTCLSSACLL
jgi:flagellar basal body-associated protein FliL